MLLSVENLSVSFKLRNKKCYAVDNVSFNLKKGEVLGLVGESGAGKSVSCYALTGLLPSPPAEITQGRVIFNPGSELDQEVDLLKLSEKQLRKIRGKSISIIFQDPMTSLNPYMSVGRQVAEPFIKHNKVSFGKAKREVIRIFNEVGISEPEIRFNQYPHEFSGGMRQRIMIAMALITKPDLLIADEPTTALDVTVQAQILKLLKKLQSEYGMGVIFITHDLGVVAELCDKVYVMYAGQIMEKGSVREVFCRSKHPYTKMLKKSIPKLKGDIERLYSIPGMPPDITDKLIGCPFVARCEYNIPLCEKKQLLPPLNSNQTHYSACLRQDI